MTLSLFVLNWKVCWAYQLHQTSFWTWLCAHCPSELRPAEEMSSRTKRRSQMHYSRHNMIYIQPTKMAFFLVLTNHLHKKINALDFPTISIPWNLTPTFQPCPIVHTWNLFKQEPKAHGGRQVEPFQAGGSRRFFSQLLNTTLTLPYLLEPTEFFGVI